MGNKLTEFPSSINLSLAASLEPFAHHWNVTSFNLFNRYYFGTCSSELAQLVPLPYSRGGSTRSILIDCMIFVSPFLDVTIMSLSTASFFAQLDSGILCL